MQTNGDKEQHFFRLDDVTQGLGRELAAGVSTRIFPGDKLMLSVVSFQPGSIGPVHSHPEEQWGVLLEGDGVRLQAGARITVSAGDFWMTPSGVPHGFEAGESGAKVLDIFSPPREAYTKKGSGFSAGDS